MNARLGNIMTGEWIGTLHIADGGTVDITFPKSTQRAHLSSQLEDIVVQASLPLRGGEQHGETFVSTIQYVKPGDAEYQVAIEEALAYYGVGMDWNTE